MLRRPAPSPPARRWLKADLQRALEASIVPDCAHSGLCSECGVCGDELGHNVVHAPPPVPAFNGHYRPVATRAQRLRFRFAKTGDAVFVGHLDMMKAWDRAFRRAALPVTADESPFAVRQRIYAALPLPLGATSGAELLEVFLTRRMDPDGVRAALQAQLPPGLDLLGVEDCVVRRADGSNGEKVSALLESVEWFLTVRPGVEEGAGQEQGAARPLGPARLAAAAEALLGAGALTVQRKAKARKDKMTKTTAVDMRPALLELGVCGGGGGGGGRRRGAAVVPAALAGAAGVVVRYRSAVDGGNPVLSPGTLCQLLADAAGEALEVGQLHRSDVALRAASAPEPDWQKLRSLLRQDGHLAAARRFPGLSAGASREV
jgi:radical SAM-linked protein